MPCLLNNTTAQDLIRASAEGSISYPLKNQRLCTVILNMKMGHRICAAVVTVFVCHSLLVYVWGETGLVQLKEQAVYRDRLQLNIEKLDQIHTDLLIERDALLYDETEIERRARALGYRRLGETTLSLPSSDRSDAARTLGSFVRRIDPEGRNHIVFRALAFAAGAAVFAISLSLRRRGKYTSQT